MMGDADAVVEPLDYSYDERDDSGRRLGAALGALPKTPSGLVLKCGGREIDRVVWGDESRPLPSSGIALSLDGATTPDSILNDDFSRWCEATDAYDDEGNLGTPGPANLPCGVTTCTDDLGSRETVPPGVGDIIVTEVYADPSGTDSNKEWLEIVSQLAKPSTSIKWLFESRRPTPVVLQPFLLKAMRARVSPLPNATLSVGQATWLSMVALMWTWPLKVLALQRVRASDRDFAS